MVFAAGILIFLVSFAVLALDVGRILSVRNELQNAADAAALAGANCLAREPKPGSTVDCAATVTGNLQWTIAKAKAADHLSKNMSEGYALESTGTGHVIDAGYWNLQDRQPTGGIFTTAPTALGTYDYPAVYVRVIRDQGVNNGPVAMLSRMFFTSFPGIALQASAVAVIPPPETAPSGKLIPVAINQCMFDLYWDKDTGAPKIYDEKVNDPPDPYSLSKSGEPYTIRIGSDYLYPECQAGQWTTFDLKSDSANVVRALIDDGNPNPLSIDDLTWIKRGVVAADYKALEEKYEGETVNILVVNAPNSDLTADKQVPISAFAGFQITDVQSDASGGGGKTGEKAYIQGQFTKTSILSGGSGVGGPFYGTYTPPRLARRPFP